MVYERYVRTLEDPGHGYVTSIGYPMYMANFAYLYFALYRHTHSPYYLEKGNRALAFIESIRNPDNTWNTWDGRAHPYYNGLFLRAYLEAFAVTHDHSYIDRAKPCAEGVRHFFDGEKVYDGSPNANIYVAVYLFEYAALAHDDASVRIAESLYAYSRGNGYYDEATGTWYFNSGTRDQRTFNGHDANYAAGMVGALLSRRRFIEKCSRTVYADLMAISPRVLARCGPFIQADGTFPYSSDAPHSVETAGIVAQAWAASDEAFHTDSSALISRAFQTVLSNQAASGAYYKNAGEPSVIDVWYGDDLAWLLPEVLGR